MTPVGRVGEDVADDGNRLVRRDDVRPGDRDEAVPVHRAVVDRALDRLGAVSRGRTVQGVEGVDAGDVRATQASDVAGGIGEAEGRD